MGDEQWLGKERRKKQVEPIHSWRWRLLSLWIVVVSSLLIIGYHYALGLINDGQKAKDTICLLQQDYKNRVDNANKYLVDHPSAKTIFGIGRDVIIAQTLSQQMTLNTLEKKVKCDLK